MRIGVVGAGAVGGCLAALLDAAGHEVHVTARSTLPVLAEHGIRLSGGFGEHVAMVRASETLTTSLDLAIVTTKVRDTEAAVAASARALADVPVMSVQNGLAGHERIARLVGHDRVAGGITTWAVQALEPGVVQVTAPGCTVVGGSEADAFLDVLEPAMPDVSRTDDLEGAQWTKLAINSSNAVPAATGMSMQECAAEPRLLRVLVAALQEAVRTGVAVGARFADVGPIAGRTVARIATSVETAEAQLRGMVAGFGDEPNLGSTLQSLRRGLPTEVDALGGAVVAAAGSVGLEAPVNGGLVAIVHENERTGGFASVDRVAALVA